MVLYFKRIETVFTFMGQVYYSIFSCALVADGALPRLSIENEDRRLRNS